MDTQGEFQQCFTGLVDLFEEPTAAAHRLVCAVKGLPVDPQTLSDEVVKQSLLWCAMFKERGTPLALQQEEVSTLEAVAEARGLTGVDPGWNPQSAQLMDDIYETVFKLQSESATIEQLDQVASAEALLLRLPETLTVTQQSHATYLRVDLAERKAQILADLGREAAADTAFRQLLDTARAADRAVTNQHYHRRMLLKYASWLSHLDADETLRWLLPVVAADTGGAPPDADTLALHCLFATFFSRFGDHMEEKVHITHLRAALAHLGLPDSRTGDYQDVLSDWGHIVRAHTSRTMERYRLLNQVFVCYTTLAGLAFQGEDGRSEDHARMLALSELLGELRVFEASVKTQDSEYLINAGEAIANASQGVPVDHQIEQYRYFNTLMEATEDEAPTEQAQNELLAYCNDPIISPPLRARALMRLAYISLNAHDLEEARQRFGSAGAIGRDHAIEDVQIEALKGMGIVKFLQEEFTEASDIAGAGIVRVEAMRENVSAPYLASTFLADKFELYVLGINSARRAGDTAAMLSRMELMKARTMQIPPGAVPESARSSARKELVALREEAAKLDINDPARDQILSRRRAIWEAMTLSNASKPDIFNLQALQSMLGSETVAISYFFLGEDVLLGTIISADTCITERIALTNEVTFYDTLVRLQNAHHGTIGIGGCLRRIARTILPSSFDPVLSDAAQVVFCPHQALHSVPFAALPWNNAPLIENRDVGIVPNLTCLLQLNPVHTGQGCFAMATRTTTSLPDRPLDHAEPEALAAATIWGQAGQPHTLLCGAELQLERLHRAETLDALSQAAIIHIGTHGSDVNEPDAMRAPMEAHLCLHDDVLDGMELSTLSLQADLVILAACHAGKRAVSARGLKRLPSDAVYGLQAAFHSAGARAILGAMWIVDDVTTMKITRTIHEILALGETPARALRNAVAVYRREADLITGDASFWAPYSLVAFGPSAFGLSTSKGETS